MHAQQNTLQLAFSRNELDTSRMDNTYMVNQHSGIDDRQDGNVDYSAPESFSSDDSLQSGTKDDSIPFDIEQYCTFDHSSPDETGVAEYDGKQISHIPNDGEMGNRIDPPTTASNDSFTFPNDGFLESVAYSDGNSAVSDANPSSPGDYFLQNYYCLWKYSIKMKTQECKRKRAKRFKIVKEKREKGLISSGNSRIKDKTRQENARKKSRNQHGQFQSA